MKAIRSLDGISTALLIGGSAASALMTFGNVDKKDFGKQKPAVIGFYGLVAMAASYKALRTITKTREEERLDKIVRVYNKADTYQRRANAYLKAADVFLRRRLKSLKRAGSS